MLKIWNCREKSLRKKVCRFGMLVIYYSELSGDVQIRAADFRWRNIERDYRRSICNLNEWMDFRESFTMNYYGIISNCAEYVCTENSN